jgi:hypothetical protein
LHAEAGRNGKTGLTHEHFILRPIVIVGGLPGSGSDSERDYSRRAQNRKSFQKSLKQH